MTDSNGEVVWKGYISPFGDSATGEGSIQEAVKFTGKELDPETGLYYFNARWYDPVLGRFTTEDPARDGVNWFVYVGHNPLRFVDPSGMWIESAWDVFSLATGAQSFYSNAKQGNWGAAAVDGVGVLLDAVAVALPGVPAGAGAGLKASRAASKLNKAGDVAQITDNVTDAITKSDEVAKKVHGNSNASKKTQHLYEIFKKTDGDVAKTGISG